MGTVYLVGGGPGDPGLLTVRAARLLKRADVVVHDALIHPALLEMAPPSAERIDVGKRCGGRHTAQERIHEILVEAARHARTVVRLKGGDPFVFGRGGEEALALRQAGVRFEVVPGITAALGVGAYAGIPLTHRDASSAVTLVAGHECAAAGAERVDWERLGRSTETLVVYMGTRRLAEIAQRLIHSGRSPLTPAAVVQWGTCATQRTVTAPLFEIADRAAAEGLGAPALVVVGEVVELRARIAWFERRPLHGLRILVPRSRAQPSRLARALASHGADVVESPRTVTRPPLSGAPLRDALRSVAGDAWVMFTSPAAVDRFWDAVFEAGGDARDFAGRKFACFGSATAAALRRRGVRPDLAVPTYVPERALRRLGEAGVGRGTSVLFPREGGRPSPLAAALDAGGVSVREVEVYRETVVAEDADAMRRQLRAGEFAVLAFASSTTVRHFVAHHGVEIGSATVAVIGESTAAAARSLGLPVHLVSHDSTLRGLVQAIRALTTVHARPGAHAGAPAGGARVPSQP